MSYIFKSGRAFWVRSGFWLFSILFRLSLWATNRFIYAHFIRIILCEWRTSLKKGEGVWKEVCCCSCSCSCKWHCNLAHVQTNNYITYICPVEQWSPKKWNNDIFQMLQEFECSFLKLKWIILKKSFNIKPIIWNRTFFRRRPKTLFTLIDLSVYVANAVIFRLVRLEILINYTKY